MNKLMLELLGLIIELDLNYNKLDELKEDLYLLNKDILKVYFKGVTENEED